MKQRLKRMSFYMLAQFADGGREVVWNDYRTVDMAQDDANNEFRKRRDHGVDVVACVVYIGDPGSSDLKRGTAVVTLFADFSTKPGEQWPMPPLPPGSRIAEDCTVKPPTRKVVPPIESLLA